ncbi:hypothetical protein [Pseudomonas oryzihabitans]|uniref:hypothetical protein n=1 Tax=Pseudomonas oryzihabitans TaxID=47885 RepID=UPI0012E8EAE2|nr:hypothetical protein [Pseudomonas oryzihabitans]
MQQTVDRLLMLQLGDMHEDSEGARPVQIRWRRNGRQLPGGMIDAGNWNGDISGIERFEQLGVVTQKPADHRTPSDELRQGCRLCVSIWQEQYVDVAACQTPFVLGLRLTMHQQKVVCPTQRVIGKRSHLLSPLLGRFVGIEIGGQSGTARGITQLEQICPTVDARQRSHDPLVESGNGPLHGVSALMAETA